LGNWLTLETLRQMAIRNGRVSGKINDVMLASPDVDVDVFANEISDLHNPRPNFSLFVSRDDQALAVSKWLWGSVDRLGAIDPQAEPYKAQLAAEHVHVYDLTTLETGDSLKHSKFATSPEVVRLLGQRLAGNSINDFHEGFVDRILDVTAGEIGGLETSLENAESTDAASVGVK
jgi:esterase/lipase superfamily enzyme